MPTVQHKQSMCIENLLIREATSEDRDFLRDMFYEAVFVPKGEEKPAYEVIDEPVLQKYTYHWMLPTDVGVMAEVEGVPVGMFWARLFPEADPGYGFVDAQTPELSIAVSPQLQGRGIGKALMAEGLKAIGERGYSQVSLSVSKDNEGAVEMYRSMGFATVSENKEDYMMVKQL